MDKWETILSQGVVIAQGFKCSSCGVLRPEYFAKCTGCAESALNYISYIA